MYPHKKLHRSLSKLGPLNFLSKFRIAAVSADVQASLNEIKELLENEDEQQIEYEAIIGKKEQQRILI